MRRANKLSLHMDSRPWPLLAIAACLIGSATPHARAADTEQAAETLALKAAHLFAGTGTALKDGGVVVVRGARIVSGGAAAPARARIIDLRPATAPPGLTPPPTPLPFP